MGLTIMSADCEASVHWSYGGFYRLVSTLTREEGLELDELPSSRLPWRRARLSPLLPLLRADPGAPATLTHKQCRRMLCRLSEVYGSWVSAAQGDGDTCESLLELVVLLGYCAGARHSAEFC